MFNRVVSAGVRRVRVTSLTRTTGLRATAPLIGTTRSIHESACAHPFAAAVGVTAPREGEAMRPRQAYGKAAAWNRHDEHSLSVVVSALCPCQPPTEAVRAKEAAKMVGLKGAAEGVWPGQWTF